MQKLIEKLINKLKGKRPAVIRLKVPNRNTGERAYVYVPNRRGQ